MQWSEHGLIIVVQRRDQTVVAVLDVDPVTGDTTERWRVVDDAWVELVPGVPRLGPLGELVTCADLDGARRLFVDGAPVTPAEHQVRAVATVDGPGIVFLANPIDDATVLHVWRYVDGELEPLTDEPGVHAVAAGGGTVAIRTTTLARAAVQWATLDGTELTSYATQPHLLRAPAVLRWRAPAGDGRAAPPRPRRRTAPRPARPVRRAAHAARRAGPPRPPDIAMVRRSGLRRRRRRRARHAGPRVGVERAVHLDLATAVLDDQVEALRAAAEEHGVLDLGRVAIRGGASAATWRRGRAATARRLPRRHRRRSGHRMAAVRHALHRAIPGRPNQQPDVYDASSLLPLADGLTRPLLLVHGLADDNVVAAHTLQLSSALWPPARPHEVLPLVGITHLAVSEVVAENLLLHQLDFLRRSLPAAARP